MHVPLKVDTALAVVGAGWVALDNASVCSGTASTVVSVLHTGAAVQAAWLAGYARGLTFFEIF